MKRRALVLGSFAAALALPGAGLLLVPRETGAPLLGRAAPEFRLPVLGQPQRSFSPQEARGGAWMLNVWASWCAACRDEHALLLELARSGVAPIYGLNYRDRPQDARAWLLQLGDPYRLSVTDAEGRAAADYGVVGVPQSYVIDRDGVIRYRRVGPVTREILDRKILPLLRSPEG